MRAVPWLAGVVPLAYYIASASAHGGALEEGGFVAAARDLTVPHAPGAPIESLLAAGFALLPVGPLPFRVAIASALCAALTLALFARALMSTLRHVGLAEQRLAALVALAVSLWLGQTPLFFQQAVRPQVFALQFSLSLLVIYTLLRFEAEEPHGSTRVLYFGAFVQGLCFANHHVYGLLMLPVAAPTLGRLFARRGFVGLMGHAAAPLLGFSVYLYVPLRLAHMPESGLAHANGLARALAMLGAEPYAGPSWAEPVSALRGLRTGLEATELGPLLALAALVLPGLWLGLSSSHRRRFGTLWLLALLAPLVSVQWVRAPRALEDAWGELLPSACALATFAALGFVWFARALSPRNMAVAEPAALALVALALWGWFAPRGQETRAEGALLDEADELWRRNLAPSAVLFTQELSSALYYRGREAEEALRADVTLVPLTAEREARALEAWAEGAPELSGTLRALVLSGELSPGELQSLSALRPVYVEPPDRPAAALAATTLREGLLWRVRSEGVTRRDLRDARGAEHARLTRLTELLQRLPEDALSRRKIERARAALERP